MHELDFIFSYRTKVFSAKADSRTAHPLAATTSNWWCSSLIVRDTPPPVLSRMVRERQDYLTAPHAAAIRPLAPGVGKLLTAMQLRWCWWGGWPRGRVKEAAEKT